MKTIAWIAGIILGFAPILGAQSTVTLVSTGAVWKYLDDGSNPGPTWIEPNILPFSFFDDSSWRSGPAQLGYGDGDEATVVRPGTNQNTRAITTYFRHEFELSDPSVIYSNLTLRVMRDDGVIVYLNGGEIFRNNMPNGPVNHQTPALADATNENAYLTAIVPDGYWYYGPNVLAAEIHQVNAASTDISFDAELTAMAGPLGPPQPIVVSIKVGEPNAAEVGAYGVPVHGSFLVRSTSALSNAFTVYFNVGGTASNGVDYNLISNQVTISAGATQAWVGVFPQQDSIVEGVETVWLQLVPPPCGSNSPASPACYTVGSQSTGTVTIADAPQVNLPPVVRIDTPTNGASLTAPANILITARASDSNGPVTSVEFFQNGQSLGLRTNSASNPAWLSLVWSNAPAGNYTLTAHAQDNHGAIATSAPVQILVTSPPLVGPRIALVSMGAVWKYMDDGSNQGEAWTDPFFFDDSHWWSGLAQLGYGDGDEATVVRPGTNQNTRAVTTYFRHRFELNDAGVVYSNLMLRVLRDDGVIVYLNGGEIFRNNMPAGPVNYLTLASAQPVDENEYITAAVPAGYLLYGPNVLAAEIHQANVNSTDISFDAELTAGGPEPQGPIVTVHVTDSWGREPGVLTVVEHAQFAVRRTGPTTNALAVSFALSGTASNGLDYTFISNSITIPIGATQALVNVAPLMDNVSEPTETVVLQVVSPLCAAVFPPPPGCYLVGSPGSGTVSILDTPFASNAPPSITILSPTNGAAFTAPANIEITVTTSDSDGTVTYVEFLRNGQVIGVRSNPPNALAFSFTWSNVSTGYYTLTARARDNQGATRLSTAVNVSVLAPSDPPPPGGELVIRFDPASLPHGSRFISNWVEQGFAFTTPAGMSHADGGLSNRPDNGTACLSLTGPQRPLTFRHLENRLFSLLELDLAEYSTVFAVPRNLTITGYKRDNSSVSTVVGLDGVIDGTGPLPDFQTFALGSEFSELTRVEIFPELYTLDNVRVIVGDVPTNSVPPRTIVDVIALDQVAGEPPHAAGRGQFSIRRHGDLTASLDVLFTISGSASNGVDYELLGSQASIQAGAAETLIDVLPLADSFVELTEQVILTLQTPVCIAIDPPPPECYLAGVSTSAVVNIINAPPTNSPLPVVTLFSPLNGSTFAPGSTILLGAMTSGTSTVSRVEFYRSGILIGAKYGPANSGADWTFLWTNPPSGPHTLRAIAIDALGVRGTSAPVSIVVGSNSVPPMNPIVFLYASDPAAAETSSLVPANAGQFTFMRYGPTNGALQVCFEILGTASNSLDYIIATNCVVIPPGASNAVVEVAPIDDALLETTELVMLKLLPSANYQAGAPSSATVLIADNDSLSSTNQPPFPRLTVAPQGSDAMTTNGCRLVLEGDGPITCVIECSVDMIHWMPIFTNTLSGAALSIVDADVNSPRRFYRLVTY